MERIQVLAPTKSLQKDFLVESTCYKHRRKAGCKLFWWKEFRKSSDEMPFGGNLDGNTRRSSRHVRQGTKETPEDPAATPCKESNKPRQATNKPRQTTKGTSGKTTHISLASRLAINNPRLSGFCFQASRRKLRNPSF